MHKLRAPLVCLLLLANVHAQSESQLEIRLTDDTRGLVVSCGAVSSRRVAVTVVDAEGAPVAGAAVTFRLPAEGPSGRFASGLTSESVSTGTDGRASVVGIHWGDVAGTLVIRVVASQGGRRASAEIPVEISASARANGSERRPEDLQVKRSGLTKWLIIAGAAGGAAVAGMAFAGKSSGPAPPTVVQPPIVTPSIGTPTISIGRP